MDDLLVKLEIIGRRQVNETLGFIVNVQNRHRVNLLLSEFSELYSDLSQELALLPRLPVTELVSMEVSHLETVQNHLNRLLDELCQRQDVLSNYRFRTYFRLNTELAADPRPVLLQVLAFDRTFIPAAVQATRPGVTVGFKEQASISHFGKIWNLLEGQHRGEVLEFDRQLALLEKIKLEEGVSVLHWHEPRNEMVMGLTSGHVMTKSLGKSQVHSESVLSLCSFGEYLLSIGGDNTLKMLNGNLQLVSGGSLKQRLGNNKLVSLASSFSQKLVFLGLNVNKILVYSLNDFNCQYLQSIKTKNVGPITYLQWDSE